MPGQAQAAKSCCQGDYKQTVSVFTWGRFKCKSPTPLYVDHFYWYLRSQINNTKTTKKTNILLQVVIALETRSTRRVQTSLTEADHYSHIAQCKSFQPW